MNDKPNGTPSPTNTSPAATPQSTPTPQPSTVTISPLAPNARPMEQLIPPEPPKKKKNIA